MTLNIPIILGTGRSGRRSKNVADFVLQNLLDLGLKSEILDVKDYHLCFTDNTLSSPQAQKLSQKVKKANALIIVSPEYNETYPGELKIMLDMLSDEYENLPLGVCSVSERQRGGGNVVNQLRSLALTFKMLPARTALLFPKTKFKPWLKN
jgi:NAD(P)H-dependent FMN reductase